MLRSEQNHYETQKAVLPHMRFPVRRRVCGSGLAPARGPDPHRAGEDRHQQPAVQEKLRAGKIFYNSMLRTSVVPTIVRGGFRENVIPAEAEATLDVRALPDENMDELMATLRNLINMQTQVTRTARPPSDRS